MGTTSVNVPFTSLRQHQHQQEQHQNQTRSNQPRNRLQKTKLALHRRNASNNSSTPSTSSGTAATAATSIDLTTPGALINSLINPLDSDPGMLEEQKRRYELQKKEAKAIWRRKQSLIRNDWSWAEKAEGAEDLPVNVADSRDEIDDGPRIDTSRNYVERCLSVSEDAALDGPIIVATGIKRKRQARHAILEEINWNQGLRLFEQRRKTWTGAVDVFLPEDRATDHAAVAAMLDDPQGMMAAIEQERVATIDDKDSSDGDSLETSNLDPTANAWGTTLLPFYMSSIPHTFSLTQPLPNTAAEKVLYKNLVVDGKTAVAPIPLANVVKACVTGLQEAEAWPPKAAPMDPLAGKVNKEKRRHRLKSLLHRSKNKDADVEADILRQPGALAGDAGFEGSD